MTKDDAKAVIELTCERLGYPVPKSHFTRVRRNGYANLSSYYISIPLRSLIKYGEPFALYYICHELAHLFLNRPGHKLGFKRMESSVMAIWGVTAGKYRGIYPTITAVVYGPRAY